MYNKMPGCGGSVCQALGGRLERYKLTHYAPDGFGLQDYSSPLRCARICAVVTGGKSSGRLRIEGRDSAQGEYMLVAATDAVSICPGDKISSEAGCWRVLSLEGKAPLRLALARE